MVVKRRCEAASFRRRFVAQADANLAALGYTEHGKRHVGLVSSIA